MLSFTQRCMGRLGKIDRRLPKTSLEAMIGRALTGRGRVSLRNRFASRQTLLTHGDRSSSALSYVKCGADYGSN